MASPPSASKMHASPSKGASSSAAALTSANRTYDAKLVTREMLRLGNFASQLPGAALGTLQSTAAAALGTATSTLVLPTAGAAASTAGAGHGPAHALGHALGHVHGGNVGLSSGTDAGAWTQLHVYVLPLFNHEQLQYPIEDLNALVRRHIEVVMSAGPSRALATLEVDVAELIGGGMTTLNTKLAGVEDDKLPTRVVELWTFFWDQVLPYVEGVFIPLQTHPLLLALHRTPKSHRPTSPTNLASPDDVSPSAAALSPIDVRMIALRAFRDKIIVPIAPRLEARLLATRPGSSFSSSTSVPGLTSVTEPSSYQHPRLQQMLLVLHSQAQHTRPPLSLTVPPPSLSPQELVIRRLLDTLSAHRRPFSGSGALVNGNGPLAAPRHRRAPSFLSGGAPRDRRGRVGIGLNGGADSDKENAKRRGRYIDDSTYSAHISGPVATAPSSHTIGIEENGTASRRRFQRHLPLDLDEDAEWEVAHAYGGTTSRGRIDPNMSMDSVGWDGETGGGATPRGRFSAERERDRNFLESLKSPVFADAEDSVPAQSSAEINGSRNDGRIGRRDDSLPALPPKDDVFSSPLQTSNGRPPEEQLDWDSAQAVVERMVGMGNAMTSVDIKRGELPAAHAHSHTPSPAPGAGPGQGPGPLTSDSRRQRMT